jgi:DivIVA domain-containing protein
MNQPEFPTVFRGYDPAQVDHHLSALQQAADAAKQEAAESSVELTKLRQSHEALSRELDGQRRELGQLQEQARKVSSPTFADLGDRIGSMLGLADEEAASIRAAAAAEVEQARHSADESAALVRAEADRYAEEVRSRADVDASEAVSRAKREADSIIDDAAREAAARREEAEAYYEKQRATAAASAADFERTLGERREKSAAEFTAQMAQQDQALAAVQERADLLGREAEDDRQAAATEASRTLEAARTEAAALVHAAKEQADRIRRDSERELAAATARRDSITAQLSNVRNMLGTLGGGAAVGLPAEEEHSLETAAAPADEASAVEAEEHAEVEAHDDAEVEAHDEAEVEAVEGDEVEAVDAALEGDDATDAAEPAEGEESPESEAVVETPKPSKAHARR